MSASAFSTIRAETLPCRSRLATSGTSWPITSRTRARISPSPSSTCSATMAPCRSRNTPSIGRRARMRSTRSAAICSKAASVTCADGLAEHHRVGSSVHPAFRAASTKPAAPTLTLRTLSKTASPWLKAGQPPPLSKASRPALLGAKVFVSWRKPPKAMRGDMLGSGRCDRCPLPGQARPGEPAGTPLRQVRRLSSPSSAAGAAARAARSRGPRRSRCSSCRRWRPRASCAACR